MSGGHSEVVPRLPIPNRTVKRLSADDSADTRVKVGHRQTPLRQSPAQTSWALCIGAAKNAMSYQPTCAMSTSIDVPPMFPLRPTLVTSPPPHAGQRPAPGCACGLCRATAIDPTAIDPVADGWQCRYEKARWRGLSILCWYSEQAVEELVEPEAVESGQQLAH